MNNFDLHHKTQQLLVTRENVYAFLKFAHIAGNLISAATNKVNIDGNVEYSVTLTSDAISLISEDLMRFKTEYAKLFELNAFLGAQSSSYEPHNVVFRIENLEIKLID